MLKMICFSALFACVAGALSNACKAEEKGERCFELRTYIAAPGKLDALNKRFREHTTKLFEKHGIKVLAYWTPTDEPKSANTLVYVCEYPSREAAKKAWAAFRADPDWIKAKAESEKDGSLTEKVESVYMKPTDYSQMK